MPSFGSGGGVNLHRGDSIEQEGHIRNTRHPEFDSAASAKESQHVSNREEMPFANLGSRAIWRVNSGSSISNVVNPSDALIEVQIGPEMSALCLPIRSIHVGV